MKKLLVVGIIVLLISVGSQTAFANIMENNPPYTPSNYSCGEEPLPLIVNLSWDGGDPDSGDTVYYDVYFDDVNPPQKIATVGPYPWNQTQIEYGPIELDYYKTYYMRIDAFDNHGAYVQGPIYNFHTGGDTTPPEVELTLMVVMGWGYVFIANCSDDTGIDRVEFTFDGEINSVDMYEPYEWAIPNEEAKNGVVCAIAYDYDGNNASDCIDFRGKEKQESNIARGIFKIHITIQEGFLHVKYHGGILFRHVEVWSEYSFDISGYYFSSNFPFIKYFNSEANRVEVPKCIVWFDGGIGPGFEQFLGTAIGNIEWS